jgi:hypothetical protein
MMLRREHIVCALVKFCLKIPELRMGHSSIYIEKVFNQAPVNFNELANFNSFLDVVDR